MRYFLLLVLLLTAAPGVQAQTFLDCNGKDFLAAVQEGFPKFACAEIGRASPGGLPVRFVRDANDKTFAAEATATAEAIATIAGAVDKALQVWTGAAAALTFREATFVIGSPATPQISTRWARFRGLTIGPAEDTGPPECIVLIDLNRIAEKAQPAPENMEEGLAFVAAHEYAHCLQRWNFFAAMRAAGSGWWVEGTASLLGSVVSPGAMTIFRDERNFLDGIAAQPIIKMSYENVLFFQWMWNTSPGSVFDLMRALPKGPGATLDGQAAALRRALGGLDSSERLADFAQKLADNGIPNAAGGLPGKLKPGGPVIVTDTGKVPLPGQAWTVQLRPVVFRGGTYLATVTGALGGRAVKKEGDTEWSADFPMASGTTDCDKEERYLMATVTTDKEAQIALDVRRIQSCRKAFALSGPMATDACVTGAWTVDEPARRALLAGWLAKDGAVSGMGGEMRFTFNADNTASVAATAFAADIAGKTDPPVEVHVAVDGTDAGQWSAAGSTLQYKSGGGTLAVDIVVNVSGMTLSAPSKAAFEDGTWAYSCTGDTLELSYTGPVPVPPDHTPRFTLRRALP